MSQAMSKFLSVILLLAVLLVGSRYAVQAQQINQPDLQVANMGCQVLQFTVLYPPEDYTTSDSITGYVWNRDNPSAYYPFRASFVRYQEDVYGYYAYFSTGDTFHIPYGEGTYYTYYADDVRHQISQNGFPNGPFHMLCYVGRPWVFLPIIIGRPIPILPPGAGIQ